MPIREKPQDVFNRTFTQGVGIGASNFQIQERERIDIAKQQAKDREKKRIENAQLKAIQTALGVGVDDPAEIDPLTKKVKPFAGKQQPLFNRSFDLIEPVEQDAGDGTPIEQIEQEFVRLPAGKEAEILLQMSPQQRQIYRDFVKRVDPSISDEYFGVKEQLNPDGKGGGLYGFNRETGKKELITELPNYKFKPVPGGSYVIYGTADLNGETIGMNGRRTRVVELEGEGGFKISDLGIIPRGSTGSKDEKTKLEFEIGMADVQNSADSLASRKQFYISGDFSKRGGESAREDHRIGYNSAMNELALRTLKFGSLEAENEGLRIWQQGRKMIRGGDMAGALKPTDMSREEYFDVMKDEILANMGTGEGQWSYRDAQSIIKFLEFKYVKYLAIEDSQADNLDFFNSVELDSDGNIK